ncbi:hypothetical protein PanWU01x14_054350 [Parasponia andersonii]|uniref:Uncharacterized protein n=1 Tax=Parasponia andersonii TaxID=3476 RepID=A0A2P5DKV8_PARAD|nr:hypothetical protein PanWU01x14_054350 [Parasponia andersonii]
MSLIADVELSMVSVGIDRTTQDKYKDWKNKPHEHFIKNRGDEKSLNIAHAHARHFVPADITQKGDPDTGEIGSIVDTYRHRYMPQVPSYVSGSSTHIVLTHIDVTMIADEVLDIRKGYKRRVDSKLKRATSTSSTTVSLPQNPLIPDSKLRDFFSQRLPTNMRGSFLHDETQRGSTTINKSVTCRPH